MGGRELVELAAKAAGYTARRWRVTPMRCGLVIADDSGEIVWSMWNPLIDDGDALRLAVKVLNWPHGGRAFDDAVTAMSAVEKLPKDPYVATRRAIVVAAAEIGRTK